MKHQTAVSAPFPLCMLWLLVVAIVPCVARADSTAAHTTFAVRWQQVDSLQQLGQTKTALDSVARILTDAKALDNSEQTVKALLYRMRLESIREEDALVKSIGLLKREIAAASFPEKPILQSLLGDSYVSFYKRNRWKILNRTTVTIPDTSDPHTWDLRTIMEHAGRAFRQSLREDAALKKISLASFGATIINHREDYRRRPTLYDVLMDRAISFFSMDDNELTRPAYEFSIDGTEFFSPIQSFIKMDITTSDTLSLKYHTLLFFQKWIAFHATDRSPEALVDADLQRLDFVRQQSVDPDRDSLYMEAVRTLKQHFQDHPVSAEITFHIAEYLHEKARSWEPFGDGRHRYDSREAIILCKKAIAAFPESYGAHLCTSLVDRIRKKECTFSCENAALPATPFKVLLSYKNVTKIFWRQLPFDAERWRTLTDTANRDSIASILAAKKPLHSWSTALPDPGDYQSHTVEIAHKELPPGHYILLCSTDPEFSCKGNAVVWSTLQVTRIACLTRSLEAGDLELLLLDRKSGIPLSGVTVTTRERGYDRNRRGYRYTTCGTYTSDENGNVTISAKDKKHRSLSLVCSKGKDQYYADRHLYVRRYDTQKNDMHNRTVFFTDRSLYRPGQTIHFKGIMLATDGEKSTITAGRKSTVYFYNVNGQEVTHLDLTSNSYGSIHGTFTAPAGVLNGRMRLSNGEGTCYISVEEYKRPKFSVSVAPYNGAKLPGDSIRITGKASTYAGQAIDGATVRYRVLRKARIPHFWWYRQPRARHGGETEIAHGTATTNDTGGFHLDFIARVDRSIPPEDHPVFTYTISVDITDITGETQSATGSVAVGYTALQLGMRLPELQPTDTPLSVSLSTTNANGVFIPSRGTLTMHRLAAPENMYRPRHWQRPDTSVLTSDEYRRLFPTDCFDHEDDLTTWKKNKRVFRGTFNTGKDTAILLKQSRTWQPGVYIAEGICIDKNGKTVRSKRYFTLYTKKTTQLPRPMVDFFVPVRDSGQPGSTARFLIGSGYHNVKILYEIEHQRKIVQRTTLQLSSRQKLIEIPIREKHRGGFSVHFVFMQDNRIYEHTHSVTVPWSNKELDLSFATFRDKLTPGQKEQWRIKIRGPKSNKIAAEMVAGLYDASLDAFAPHSWTFSIYPTYYPRMNWHSDYGLSLQSAQRCSHDWNTYHTPPGRHDPELNLFGYRLSGIGRPGIRGIGYGAGYASAPLMKSRTGAVPAAPRRAMLEKKSPGSQTAFTRGGFAQGIDDVLQGVGGLKRGGGGSSAKQSENGSDDLAPDLSSVKARSNLNETAFFFPTLTTDEKGEVTVNFTIPEALTTWNMLGFAHTKDMCYGQITGSLVTRKELMVVPHLPRFFRENDQITLTAKIVNMSGKPLTGTAQLFLFDAATMQPVNALFSNGNPSQSFDVKKKRSTPLSWNLSVPEGIGAVTCRVVAKTGKFSDGEEQVVPILTNRMLVTESVPLSIRKKGSKNYSLPNLQSQNSGSNTLRNHRLTLEFSENPAWYAVQALPYLMEYPYECAEQVFSRFYANSIASHIANSSPRIKAIFDQWRNQTPDALLSTLEKNSELKALALEETPWVLDGKNESERKKRVAQLFDRNAMADGKARALQRLQTMQLPNGAWPWFEGSPDDRYITQYIATGLGRLEHLGILDLQEENNLQTITLSALHYLDNYIRKDYQKIRKGHNPDDDHLSELHIQYLYMRSFFPNVDIPSENREAVDYFTGQAKDYWNNKRRYMQGMIALALYRSGNKKLPPLIVRSLSENAIVNEEFGMYWKEMYEGRSWWWYQAPIESQALMVEVFDEVAHDTTAVEACKAWLLKSKQTQNWHTTKATAEACYALLLRGVDNLAQPAGVSIKLGTTTVNPKNSPDLQAEAGTGYFKTSWCGSDIHPTMGDITVSRKRSGVAWGALYWQYFEQLDKIVTALSPLNIDKRLFIRNDTDRGAKLTPVSNTKILHPGDRITVRIKLRADRNMEYVHMKDMRASGFEPRNVFSGYRWQDGLGYYESTRDAATNFFFPVLGKGTYVFEYPLVVAHSGTFSNGITTAQCMYAPEFASHSEGVRVTVKP